MGIRRYLKDKLDRLLYRREINEQLGHLAQQLAASADAGATVDTVPILEMNRKLDSLAEKIRLLENDAAYVDKGTQLLLALHYRELLEKGKVLSFDQVSFRNHSQADEDGILWYIFSLIGTASKSAIEICAGHGKECNSANLIVNHGWHALLVDGDADLVAQSNQYYQTHASTQIFPPRAVCEWVTADNVNDILCANGFQSEVDLLTLDLDGVDYWIWKALTAVSPRVVVVEVQPVWGCTRSVTVPYRPDFQQRSLSEGEYARATYCGASLPAFVKLARQKGYRLIGGNRIGYNVFFMRDDVGADIFPEIAQQTIFSNPVASWAYSEGRPLLEELEWVEV